MARSGHQRGRHARAIRPVGQKSDPRRSAWAAAVLEQYEQLARDWPEKPNVGKTQDPVQ